MSTSWLIKILTVSLVVGFVLAQSPGGRRKPQGHAQGRRKYQSAPKEVEEVIEDEERGETSDECPELNGYFPDAEQCDKYHSCNNGVSTDKLCPDGMVFNDYSPDQEKCDLPYNIDCSKRTELQTPQPTEHCPRLNGYFGHEKTGVCDQFYYCVDGKFNMITCPAGLVFNPKSGICTWPDEAQKKGCSSKDIFQNFSCPKVSVEEGQTHPRYADPDDCQYFYVCINGDTPRRNGCKLGQAFDDANKRCDWARKIPECADWYKDRYTDAELEELENPKPKATKAPSSPSRRKGNRRPKPTVESEQDEE